LRKPHKRNKSKKAAIMDLSDGKKLQGSSDRDLKEKDDSDLETTSAITEGGVPVDTIEDDSNLSSLSKKHPYGNRCVRCVIAAAIAAVVVVLYFTVSTGRPTISSESGIFSLAGTSIAEYTRKTAEIRKDSNELNCNLIWGTGTAYDGKYSCIHKRFPFFPPNIFPAPATFAALCHRDDFPYFNSYVCPACVVMLRDTRGNFGMCRGCLVNYRGFAAFDCSNLLTGPCVGYTVYGTCISNVGSSPSPGGGIPPGSSTYHDTAMTIINNFP